MVSVAEALAIGTQHLQAGKLAEAERILRQILQVDPQNAQALFLLGSMALQTNHLELALQLLGDAIRLDDSQALYHANLGEALRHLNRLDDALSANLQAVRLDRQLPSGQLNLSLVYAQRGEWDAAIRHSREALRLDPRAALAYTNLAFAHHQKGEFAQAAAVLRDGLRVAPDDVRMRAHLAQLLFAESKFADAEACLRRAAAVAPNDASIQFNLAGVLYTQGKSDEALDCYRKALALNPNDPSIHANMANILSEQGQGVEAIEHRRIVDRMAPVEARWHSDLLYSLHYLPVADRAALLAEHRQWGQRHADALSAARTPHANDRSPDRKLRIGYVSPHFRAHAVSFFVEPILACHDHDLFEVVCYSSVAAQLHDETTARMRRHADRWQQIDQLSDEQAAERICQDKIDILVDLAGHIGENRLLIFARKPAPVQVTYIGYQDTTGMLAMDYRLTDDWADPPGTTDRYYTERLVRLPQTFFCYQPSNDAPPVGPLPEATNGLVTFGSFNNFVKITPQALAVWADVLRRVPGSRLRILAKASNRLRDYVETAFEQQGVDPDRVEVCHHRPRNQYLELIAGTDIALDAFPFNGHTTTCDALWQGVPVVTLAGDSYVSRFGSSAHHSLGLEDLVASSVEQYAQIATQLAHDKPRLAELRATLRARMSASPILDHRQFTRNLEAAYRQMWHDWCRQAASA